MKFYNNLLITLICLTIVYSLRRRKTTFDEEFDVFIRIDGSNSKNTEYQGRARRVDVMDDAKAKPLGLYFYQLPKIGDVMAQALVKDGDSYYLPYRIVTSEWKAIRTGRTSRDFVQTTIKIGKVNHTFKLKVKYNTLSANPVTYEELILYASKLHSKSIQARAAVNTLVTELQGISGDFAQQKKNIEDAKKGVDSVKAALAVNQEKLKTLETQQTAKNGELLAVQSQITKAITELSLLRVKEESFISEIRGFDDSIKTLNSTIIEQNKNLNEKTVSSKPYEIKQEQDRKLWTEKSTLLEKKAPEFQAPASIKTATVSFNNADVEGVKTNLDKVIA